MIEICLVMIGWWTAFSVFNAMLGEIVFVIIGGVMGLANLLTYIWVKEQRRFYES